MHIDAICQLAIMDESPATQQVTPMETPFITLAALARDLSLSEKQVRRKLTRLIAANRLQQGVDFEKADYQSETRFIYMIEPQKFIREARLQEQALRAVGERKKAEVDSQPDNTGQPNSSQSASQAKQSGSQSASPEQPSDTPPATPPKTRDQVMVDFLKEELIEKNAELKEWRGLLPEYQTTVKQLIVAKEELARLLPPDPKNYPDRSPLAKTDDETEGQQKGSSEEGTEAAELEELKPPPVLNPEAEPNKVSQIEQ